MSQVGREDWWTMPLGDFAKHVWELGLDPRTDQGRLTAVTALLQTRAVLQAAKDTSKLVFATWALVVATIVVALVAVLGDWVSRMTRRSSSSASVSSVRRSVNLWPRCGQQRPTVCID
jgi:hypothetical protein